MATDGDEQASGAGAGERPAGACGDERRSGAGAGERPVGACRTTRVGSGGESGEPVFSTPPYLWNRFFAPDLILRRIDPINRLPNRP